MDVLRLARPSVSEQIAHLEAELGVALFVRTGRRLQLTDAGRLLQPEAERTLAAASDASEVVRRARTLTGGTASLGLFSTAEHLLLPGLVEDFARRHPEVAIRVVGEHSSELAARAQRAGITIRPRIEVQHAHAALELAARGLGDTLVTRALVDGLGYGGRLAGVPLEPPLHEVFAFISRRNARLSPATRALMALAEQHLGSSADQDSPP